MLFKHFARLKKELKTWDEVEEQIKDVIEEFTDKYSNIDFFMACRSELEKFID